MSVGADDFYLFSASELLSSVDGKVDLEENRIVGLYGEYTLGMSLGVGGEGVYFRGVDTQTGKVVEAYYAGATLGASASPLPVTVGAGVFGFTGAPSSLGGWSAGGQGSSAITGGVSISGDGSVLHFYGANTSLGVNAAGGYTYRVKVDGETTFRFGPIEHYDYSFTGNQYDAAMFSLVNSPRGQVELQYAHPDGYVITQLFQRVDAGGGAYRVNVVESITDRNGNPVSEAIASQYISNRVWQFDISNDQVKNIRSFEHCFPAETLIMLADGSYKPIEDIRHGDHVLSFDTEGNLTVQTVTKLFTNTTISFIRLSFDNERDDLVATPGHRFLTETGDFLEIGYMMRLGGGNVRLVEADGNIVTAHAERLEYSAETAYMFEQAQAKTIRFFGNGVLQDEQAPGWRTYNFEVAETHTYIANGIRVHNRSVTDFLEDHELQNLKALRDTNGDGKMDFAVVDIDNGNVEYDVTMRTVAGNSVQVVREMTAYDENGDLYYKRFIKDANGNVIRVVNSDLEGQQLGEDAGKALTPIFAQSFIGADGSVFEKVAANTVIDTLLGNLGEVMGGYAHRFAIDEGSFSVFEQLNTVSDAAFRDLGGDFAVAAIDSSISVINQLIVSEIFEGLELDGIDGAVFEGLTSYGINEVLRGAVGNLIATEAFQDILTSSGFSDASIDTINSAFSGNAFESFNPANVTNIIFSAVFHEIVPPLETLEGQAASVITNTLVNFFNVAGQFGGPAGVVLGYVVGKFFDAIFGENLDPRAFAHIGFDEVTGHFKILDSYSADGGDEGLARDMAQKYVDGINGFVDTIMSNSHNYDEIGQWSIGHYHDSLVNAGKDGKTFAEFQELYINAYVNTVAESRHIDGQMTAVRALNEISADQLVDTLYNTVPGRVLQWYGSDEQREGAQRQFYVGSDGVYSIESSSFGGEFLRKAYKFLAQDRATGHSSGGTTYEPASPESLENSAFIEGFLYHRILNNMIRTGLEYNTLTDGEKFYLGKMVREALKTGEPFQGTVDWKGVQEDVYYAYREQVNSGLHWLLNNPRNNDLREEFRDYIDQLAGREVFTEEEIYHKIGMALTVADDYHRYLENQSEINTQIAINPDSAFAAGWVTTLLQAKEMGLANRYNLTGDGIGNNFYTADGNDIVRGMGGHDDIRTYGGKDSLTGGNGNDRLNAGGGDDTLSGEAGIDRLWGGSGDDLTYGGDGTDLLWGEAGDDRLEGNANLDTLWGGDGDDTLNGGSGADRMNGGKGDDVFWVDNTGDLLIETANGGRDRINAGIGIDLIRAGGVYANVEDIVLQGTGNLNARGSAAHNMLIGNAGANSLNGRGGNDTLSGGGGNDTLIGEAGNDTLNGGAGADAMNGGTGNDLYMVNHTGDIITETANGGNDTINTSIGIDLIRAGGVYANVEHIILAGSGNLNARGSAANNSLTGNAGTNSLNGRGGNDTLIGGAGNDTLIGETGNDFLNGGAGADVMNGGAGNDRYVINHGADIIIEAAGGGNDTIETTFNIALNGSDGAYANVENVDLKGAGNLGAWGTSANNRLTGNSGNNQLSGHDGNDSLYGNDGNDTLSGGSGNNTLDGGAGADTLYGGYHDDELDGGDGNDDLRSGAGNDTLTGGSGRDRLDGGAGIDLVSYSQNTSGVTANLLDSTQNAGGAAGDTFFFIENLYGTSYADTLRGDGEDNVLWGDSGIDRLYGRAGNDALYAGAGDDVLIGDVGNDRLHGSDGNDRLKGDAGNDTLNGGGGNDVFIFTKHGNQDRIKDFQNNIDTIELRGFGISSFTQAKEHASQSGEDVIFDLGNGDRLIVENTTINALADDLIYG